MSTTEIVQIAVAVWIVGSIPLALLIGYVLRTGRLPLPRRRQ